MSGRPEDDAFRASVVAAAPMSELTAALAFYERLTSSTPFTVVDKTMAVAVDDELDRRLAAWASGDDRAMTITMHVGEDFGLEVTTRGGQKLSFVLIGSGRIHLHIGLDDLDEHAWVSEADVANFIDRLTLWWHGDERHAFRRDLGLEP